MADLQDLRGQRIDDILPRPSGTQGQVAISTVRSPNDGTVDVRDQTIADLAPGEGYWSRKELSKERAQPVKLNPSKSVQAQAIKTALQPLETIARGAAPYLPAAMRLAGAGIGGTFGAAAVEPFAQQAD